MASSLICVNHKNQRSLIHSLKKNVNKKEWKYFSVRKNYF